MVESLGQTLGQGGSLVPCYRAANEPTWSTANRIDLTSAEVRVEELSLFYGTMISRSLKHPLPLATSV